MRENVKDKLEIYGYTAIDAEWSSEPPSAIVPPYAEALASLPAGADAVLILEITDYEKSLLLIQVRLRLDARAYLVDSAGTRLWQDSGSGIFLGGVLMPTLFPDSVANDLTWNCAFDVFEHFPRKTPLGRQFKQRERYRAPHRVPKSAD